MSIFLFRNIVQHKTITETPPQVTSSFLKTPKEKVGNSQKITKNFSVLNLLVQLYSYYNLLQFLWILFSWICSIFQPVSKRTTSSNDTYPSTSSKLQKLEYSAEREKPISTTINKTTKQRKMKQPQANNKRGKPDAAPKLPPTVESTSDTPESLV